MKHEYLYVCDGQVADCPKSHCHYNGTGRCRHTTNVGNALYPEPREWAWKSEEKDKVVHCEAVR